jgi:hypothetical protein
MWVLLRPPLSSERLSTNAVEDEEAISRRQIRTVRAVSILATRPDNVIKLLRDFLQQIPEGGDDDFVMACRAIPPLGPVHMQRLGCRSICDPQKRQGSAAQSSCQYAGKIASQFPCRYADMTRLRQPGRAAQAIARSSNERRPWQPLEWERGQCQRLRAQRLSLQLQGGTRTMVLANCDPHTCGLPPAHHRRRTSR